MKKTLIEMKRDIIGLNKFSMVWYRDQYTAQKFFYWVEWIREAEMQDKSDNLRQSAQDQIA